MGLNNTARISVVQHAYPCELQLDFDSARIVESIYRNVRHIAELVRKAGESKMDIICTSEDTMGFAHFAFHAGRQDLVCEIIDQTQDNVAGLYRSVAKEIDSYILACWFTKESEKIYNTAHLINREGEIVGQYKKTHLPPEEEGLCTPGDDYPVFETDFGRVACLICWDLMLPETSRILMLNGAQIIFVPTLGFDFGGEAIGEMRMRMRAFDNGLYIASAMPASPKCDRPGRSLIVSPQGQILADAGYKPDTYIRADVDLSDSGKDISDPDSCYGLSFRQRWLKSRCPGTYTRLTD